MRATGKYLVDRSLGIKSQLIGVMMMFSGGRFRAMEHLANTLRHLFCVASVMRGVLINWLRRAFSLLGQTVPLHARVSG